VTNVQFGVVRQVSGYWQHSSVVRTSVSGWRADFPRSVPDLLLKCDHLVCKLSAMDQPTRPTQLSIPLESVNE